MRYIISALLLFMATHALALDTYPVTVSVTGLLGTGNSDDYVDLQNNGTDTISVQSD